MIPEETPGDSANAAARPMQPCARKRKERKERRETNYEAAMRVQRDNAAHRLANVQMVAAVEAGLDNISFEGASKWAKGTSSVCWHCCHPFDNPPLGMPVRYDPLTDHIILRGTFCTLDCCKAHMKDDAKGGPDRQSLWLLELVAMRLRAKMRASGRSIPEGASYRGVRCAPPRTALEMFGGFLDIAQFREGSHTIEAIDTLEPFKKVSWTGVQMAIRGVTMRNTHVGGSAAAKAKVDAPQPSAPPPPASASASASAPPAPAPVVVPKRVPKHTHKTLEHFLKKK